MIKFKSCFALLALGFSIGCSAGDTTIGKACTDEAKFEVSELVLALDFEHVKKINVLNTDKASAHVSFIDGWLPDLHVMTTDETQISGGINERGGFEKLKVNSISDLFKKAKHDSSNDEYFVKVKHAMGLSKPDSIHVMQHQNGEVFLIEDGFSDGADAIYVIRKDDPRIMMLVSNLDNQETKRLLEHVCLQLDREQARSYKHRGEGTPRTEFVGWALPTCF